MRSYWDWQEVIAINKAGTALHTGDQSAVRAGKRSRCSRKRDLRTSSRVTAPQRRDAAAKVWGLETQCQGRAPIRRR